MSEQHLQAGKVDEAEEVLDVVFPSDDESAEVLHPGEQAFHSPAPPIATQRASVLRLAAAASVRGDHLDAVRFTQPLIQLVGVIRFVADQSCRQFVEEASSKDIFHQLALALSTATASGRLLLAAIAMIFVPLPRRVGPTAKPLFSHSQRSHLRMPRPDSTGLAREGVAPAECGKETAGLKFRTKNRKSRTVPFGHSLVDALEQHQQPQPKGTLLVFPDKDGKPWFHIIRILKKRAFDAGLNCGHCETKRRKDACATAPVCELWYLHRFRHTFACWHLRNGVDLRTLQLWMGHQEMETTTIYLSKIRNTSDSTKALVNGTFAGMDAAVRKTDAARAKPPEVRALPADDDEEAEAAFLSSFSGAQIPQTPRLDTKA